jgi:hypothetical protein
MGLIMHNEKIFFGIPCATRNIDVDCIVAVNKKIRELGGMFHAPLGISNIPLARNLVVNKFKESNCDWLMMVDSDIIFSDDDWNYLWEGEENIVIGPYARKIPGLPCNKFGLGFTRVHRSVFDKLDKLENIDGTETAQRFYLESQIMVHYFPVGVTGDSRWLDEDRGFFLLCAMAGIFYRIEERCRLGHVGAFIYGYPNQDNGSKFWLPSLLSTED